MSPETQLAVTILGGCGLVWMAIIATQWRREYLARLVESRQASDHDKEAPPALWHTCTSCGLLVSFYRRVCPHCEAPLIKGDHA